MLLFAGEGENLVMVYWFEFGVTLADAIAAGRVRRSARRLLRGGRRG